MEPLIRTPRPSEFGEWKQLWDDYLAFYETDLSDGHAEVLWARIHDPDHPIACFVAEANGTVVGFTHYLHHDDTWEQRSTCYLQDLLVDAAHRGEGIGRALIEAVVAEAGARGWSTVYWLTAEDNTAARRLYDRMTGGASGFLMYQLSDES